MSGPTDDESNKPDVLNPNAGLLCKLGSLVVHVEESLETGETLDISAIRGLLADPEVSEWRKGMDAMALLPVKR